MIIRTCPTLNQFLRCVRTSGICGWRILYLPTSRTRFLRSCKKKNYIEKIKLICLNNTMSPGASKWSLFPPSGHPFLPRAQKNPIRILHISLKFIKKFYLLHELCRQKFQIPKIFDLRVFPCRELTAFAFVLWYGRLHAGVSSLAASTAL